MDNATNNKMNNQQDVGLSKQADPEAQVPDESSTEEYIGGGVDLVRVSTIQIGLLQGGAAAPPIGEEGGGAIMNFPEAEADETNGTKNGCGPCAPGEQMTLQMEGQERGCNPCGPTLLQ